MGDAPDRGRGDEALRPASPTTQWQGEADDEIRQVARLFDEAALWLTRVPEGPLRSQLHHTLERYQRTLREWDDRAPSDAQRAILLQGAKIVRSAIARATFAPDGSASVRRR